MKKKKPKRGGFVTPLKKAHSTSGKQRTMRRARVVEGFREKYKREGLGEKADIEIAKECLKLKETCKEAITFLEQERGPNKRLAILGGELEKTSDNISAIHFNLKKIKKELFGTMGKKLMRKFKPNK